MNSYNELVKSHNLLLHPSKNDTETNFYNAENNQLYSYIK